MTWNLSSIQNYLILQFNWNPLPSNTSPSTSGLTTIFYSWLTQLSLLLRCCSRRPLTGWKNKFLIFKDLNLWFCLQVMKNFCFMSFVDKRRSHKKELQQLRRVLLNLGVIRSLLWEIRKVSKKCQLCCSMLYVSLFMRQKVLNSTMSFCLTSSMRVPAIKNGIFWRHLMWQLLKFQRINMRKTYQDTPKSRKKC